MQGQGSNLFKLLHSALGNLRIVRICCCNRTHQLSSGPVEICDTTKKIKAGWFIIMKWWAVQITSNDSNDFFFFVGHHSTTVSTENLNICVFNTHEFVYGLKKKIYIYICMLHELYHWLVKSQARYATPQSRQATLQRASYLSWRTACAEP